MLSQFFESVSSRFIETTLLDTQLAPNFQKPEHSLRRSNRLRSCGRASRGLADNEASALHSAATAGVSRLKT
jgi:hypothetical protein